MIRKKITCLLMLLMPMMAWAENQTDSIVATPYSTIYQWGSTTKVQVPAKHDTVDNNEELSLVKRRRLQRIDREVMKATFIPKGNWMLGGAISYYELNEENLNFLVLKDVTGKGYNFSVSPCIGYFFRDNMAVGLRYNYNRTYMDLGNLDLNLGEDFNIGLKDLYWLEHKYDAAAFLRTYMPIGRSKIFGFFNEVRLAYSYSQGKNSTGSGTEYDGTYETAHHLQIGCAPGLAAFITDFAAVEVSVGMMGYGVKWADQRTNQIEHGKKTSVSGNFKINLFSINIGMSLYL